MSRPVRPADAPAPAGDPRAEIVVDLDAVRANVARLKELADGASMMTVVKADGYGHGIAEVARAARAGGAEWLGAAVAEEALALRAAGDTGPVLTWLAVPGEDRRPLLEAGVDVAAYSVGQLEEILAAARDVGRPARVQLKVDTGLSRGGCTPELWPGLVAAAARAQDDGLVRVTGIWSHLACADEPEHPANDAQERVFAEACAAAERLEPELRHLANSAATVLRPSARLDLVRCGIASYGLSPAPDVVGAAELGLVPAMTVRTRLAAVKRVPAGAGVSYGHTEHVDADTTIGLVPLGYADGIPRHGSSRAEVHVAGRRRRVLGRVCMDQLVVEVDPDSEPGDTVVVFGSGADGVPTAQDWADACGTISYEIVSRVGGRLSRRHVGATDPTAANAPTDPTGGPTP